MAKNEAKIKFTAETGKFNDAIKKSNDELSELRAEFKLNEAEMQNTGKTVEGLEKKHENLEKQLKASQDKTEALSKKVEKAVEIFGENSVEVSKLKIQLANAQTAEEKLKTAVSNCENEIKAQADAAEEAAGATNKLTAEIDDQQEELTQLKKKYADLILENKECTDEAKDLERQIGDLSSELKKSKDAFADAEKKADALDKSLDDAGDAAEDSADGFTIAKGAVADLASEAIQMAIGKISEFVGYLAELPEATRELRQDMATLETSYETAGFTVEQATGTWKELYKIFGEDDRAVEAANHIAKFAENQQDLNSWVNITKGIWGTYQDSLPVEGLAEAANETTKTGQVTGVLADALNWSSEAASMFSKYMSEDVTTAEDAFNVALSECTTEQERQTLITETLTALYGDAAKKYDEASGAQTEAKEAAADNILVQNQLGETLEPLTTAWQGLKNEMLSAFIPAAEKVSAWGVDALAWMKEHPVLMKTLGAVLGVVAAALSALIIVVTAYTVAQWAMNAAVLANPITWIIVGIVAAIAAVVAIIVLVIEYWDKIVAAVTNCWTKVKETLSQWGDWINQNVIQPIVGFFKGLWDGIVGIFKSVIDWVKNNWQAIVLFMINPFAGIFKYLYDNFEGFRNVVNNVVTAIKDFFVNLWNNIVSAYHTVIDPWIEIIKRAAALAYETIILPIKNFFVDLWNSIVSGLQAAWNWCVSIASAVAGWVNANVIQPVTNFFVGLWNKIKSGASTAWNGIKSVFSTISNWVNSKVVEPVKNAFSNAWNAVKNGASNAWNGIKSVFSKVASFFGDIFSKAWQKVKSVFSAGGKIFDGIKDGIVNAFKTVVNAIIKGINKVVSIPFNGLNKILGKLAGLDILGVSPFSWLTWRASVPQIPLLAQGGYVAANSPQLAIVGDNRHEGEIIAPESKIAEAVERGVRAVNLEALAAAVEDLASRPIALNINGRQFALATAGDTDNISGMRTRFKERGLILD